MRVPAWCGTCGQRFDLAEALASTPAGRCPRCGHDWSPAYSLTLVESVRQVLVSAESLRAGLAQLGQVAPGLHVELPALAEELQ